MFPDIGFSEILVVALVILLVSKPGDFPVLMRKLGVFVAHMQAFMRGMVGGWQEQAAVHEEKTKRKRKV